MDVFVGVSLGKTLQSPSLVLVKPRENIDNVSCPVIWLKVLLGAALKHHSLIFSLPNKPWYLRVSSTSLLKTLREKEKLLVTSNFFFSNCVFYPFGELSAIFIYFKIVVCKLFQFGRKYILSFGIGLTKRQHFFTRPNWEPMWATK